MKNLKVSQLKPLAGYVLVEPTQPEEKTASGIILPSSGDEKPQYGTVLACGENGCVYDDCDCTDKKSKKNNTRSCECPVTVGDLVVYKKWGGNEVIINDVEYQFLKFEDVLAVIKSKK